MKNAIKKVHDIPTSFSRLFKEYDFQSMNIDTHANVIIERTLEMGTWEELHWLFHQYGVSRIIAYIQRLGHRRLSKVTFHYWCKLLEIKEFQKAPFAEIRDEIWSNHR